MVLLKHSSRSVLYRSYFQKFPKINRKTPVQKCLFKNISSLKPAALLERGSREVFSRDFARFFRIPILDLITVYYAKKFVPKNPTKFTENSCERLLLVLVRIRLVWPTAKLLMFCRIDCKSVFKVLSLFTEMQYSTDFALMSTKSMY